MPVLPVVLLRQWRLAVLAALVLLAGGYAGLRVAWGAAPALMWAIMTALAGGALFLFALRNLSLNARPAEAATFSDLGPANWLTIVRGMAAAGLTGFIVLPRPPGALAWLPPLFYSIVIWLDLTDGYVARVTGRVTTLGVKLDMEYDCFGGLIASALAVRYGQAPGWYFSWGLARYVFVAGLWWLERQGRPLCPVRPASVQRIAAGLNMAFVSAALMPLFGPPATTVAAACFLAPLLIGFGRDWLVISGTISEDAASYRRIRRAYGWALRWVPPALRLAAAVIAGVFLVSQGGAVALLALLGGLGLLLGVVSRFSALVVFAALCLDLLARGYQSEHAFLTVALVGILYLGNGAYALWPVDDGLFVRRRGGRTSPPGPLS